MGQEDEGRQLQRTIKLLHKPPPQALKPGQIDYVIFGN
jgi:hypothetical protein